MSPTLFYVSGIAAQSRGGFGRAPTHFAEETTMSDQNDSQQRTEPDIETASEQASDREGPAVSRAVGCC